MLNKEAIVKEFYNDGKTMLVLSEDETEIKRFFLAEPYNEKTKIYVDKIRFGENFSNAHS